MGKELVFATLGAVSCLAAGCIEPEGGDGATNRTREEIEEAWTLAQRADEASIEIAYTMWSGANRAATRELVELVDAETSMPDIGHQSVWNGVKLPVAWEWWPTGKYPYEATSAKGVCGPDADLVAKYDGIHFTSPSQLRLETNNGVTYAIAAAHGWQLTAYVADNVTERVEICAGLGPVADLPVVENQLASMTLAVK